MACSSKVAYHYLDWIIEWYIADYVTLDDTQEWLLRDALKKGLSWHKSSQLPLYVSSLDQLKGDIESELTQQELLAYVDTYNGFWLNIRTYVIPAAMNLLTTLTPEQINQLMENLEEKNQEHEDEYANKPIETRYKERSERMIERLEHWIDDLSPAQRRTVQQWSRELKPISKQWIANRRHWQQQFLTRLYQKRTLANQGANKNINNTTAPTLNHAAFDPNHAPAISVTLEKNLAHDKNNESGRRLSQQHNDKPVNALSNAELDQQLNALLLNSRQFWTAEYTRQFNFNLALTLDLLLDLEKQLSARQRKHLLTELVDLRDQLHAIR